MANHLEKQGKHKRGIYNYSISKSCHNFRLLTGSGAHNEKLMFAHLYLMFRLIMVHKCCKSASLQEERRSDTNYEFNFVSNEKFFLLHFTCESLHHDYSPVLVLKLCSKCLELHLASVVAPEPVLVLPIVLSTQPQFCVLFICKRKTFSLTSITSLKSHQVLNLTCSDAE